MKFPFCRNSLMFYPINEAGLYLGVNARSVKNWIDKKEVDAKYAHKIKEFHTFPIDPPPVEAGIIGNTAYDALCALRAGHPEIAELLTDRALLIDKDFSWSLGLYDELTPLKKAYCVLANALAWVRHDKPEFNVKGKEKTLCLFEKLNEEENYVPVGIMENRAWEYLKLMTSTRKISYSLQEYTQKLRESDGFLQFHIEELRGLLERSEQFPRSYLRALISWNLSQLAALDDHEALFIESIDNLASVYGTHMDVIMNLLRGDEDTKPMLERERVKVFCTTQGLS